MSTWVRLIFIVLPFSLLVAGVGYFVNQLAQNERFAVRSIELKNEPQYVTHSEILEVVKTHLNKGFFRLDVEAIQKSILTLPWVSEVKVKRVWPDKVAIEIQEHVALACWNDKGILTTEGYIFYPNPNTISEKLPKFSGEGNRAKEMLQQYFSALEQLTPIGLMVKSMALSPTGTWQMVLDNEIGIILGKAGFIERLTRFAEVYQVSLKTQKAGD